ncbi:hypothetical protein AJ78_02943 [Emergomyces pasteurianus Ep9510]|uniref:Uncharacterized protein n=1 Tax=Emergomyces pasteurianus Ep9510 TaxID=1447872 RepID=A0A1J9PM01_9EURO|nr:hypothetical protein AJ78_02943 [Emergomyces pasteurianus Ep9510]
MNVEQNIFNLNDLYSALLQTRRDIEKYISALIERLQHLRDAEKTGDIQKYLQEFYIDFHELHLLFGKLLGFTSRALSIDIETEELSGLRWHITSFWEEYGHIQQIVYTYSLCCQSQDAKLRRGVAYLLEQMGDLQVVCEERKKQLEADLFNSAY